MEEINLPFEEGTMLLVDKPAGWTSFDVVNKVRYSIKRRLGVKKIKVGHAGTLDPMATGLLILCTGKWTKRINEFQDMDKWYTATVRFGATTPSYDAETRISEEFPYKHITLKKLERALEQFQGEIEQVPPVFSAIKVDGKPLYHYARKGKEVKVRARTVHIHELTIENFELPEATLRIHCSKGTYIRSLAHDLGKALGSGAYLTALERTAIGPYSLKNSHNLNTLVEGIESGVRV